jgi:transposase-like protein
MSEQIANRQVCSHCSSPRTRYAGIVGRRQVWRCSDCNRTFWPRKKGSSVLLRIRALLAGESGR